MGGGTRTTRVEGDDERNGRIENEEQLEELKAFITNDKDSSDLDKVLQEEAAERARAHLQDVLKDHLVN